MEEEPVLKKRRGRPRKGEETRWAESCTQLVQSGQRQAGPWCCAVCNERWDADIQTRRKHGWVCVRTDAPLLT
jgi:hypothetical protein